MSPQTAASKTALAKRFLKRRSDYLKTYKTSPIRLPLVSLYVRPNGEKEHRLGYTIPKQVGKAVLRNRMKRWCREIYKTFDLDACEVALDLNVVVGGKGRKAEIYIDVSYEEFGKQLRSAFLLAVKNHK